MPRTRTGTVYTLTDPRDRKIRYIGQTTQPINDRLSGHLSRPTNPAMRAWIASLGREGRVPSIKAVATVPKDQLLVEEERQIRRHADAGHRLFNAPYYQQHLGDLDTQASAPRKPRRKRNHLAWAMYAGLEQARSQGRIPFIAAAVVLIVTSPLCGSLLLAHAALMSGRRGLKKVLNSTLGVALLACAGWTWVLWDAGFDKAAKRLPLPRLPVEAALAIWHVYLAAPLWRLAVEAAETAACIAALMAIGAYFDIADTIRHHQVRGQ